jgi:hypothetical protein
MPNEPQTLSQRLAEGRLPVADALRIAVQLGDALRHIHDEGQVQGTLTPDHVILAGSDLELLPAESSGAPAITPYTAPELLQEGAPDIRTDVFAFGAIVFEMLTGRRAFFGDTSEALAESIVTNVPPPIGVAGFDRLVSTCLAKDPAARWQRMQQALTEIKLATSVRRAENGAVPRHQQVQNALRAEIEELESRLASRLEQYEQAALEMQRTHAEEMARRQAASLEAMSEALNAVRAQVEETSSHIDLALERASHAEQAAEGSLGEIAGLHVAVADELHHLNEKFKAQATAMESARNGMARTDDLVERVVEALEVLQGMVLEHGEERTSIAS